MSTAAAAAPAAAGLHVPGKGRLLFTSESVTEGHPDKLCDCVSDAVLDACIAQDPSSRVAVETAVKGDFLLLFGEVTTRADVDYAAVAREAARAAGYAGNGAGFDADRAEVKVLLTRQAPEIAEVRVGRQGCCCCCCCCCWGVCMCL
jgi:S-adenosylmethionine synthetase